MELQELITVSTNPKDSHDFMHNDCSITVVRRDLLSADYLKYALQYVENSKRTKLRKADILKLKIALPKIGNLECPTCD